MSADHSDRYVFEAEWYDKVACILKKFYLYYYPSDNTVELFDLKTRKTFLRRTTCEGIKAKDFYVGSVITIFSRCIKITDYADACTKTKLETQLQKVFVLLKPDVIDKMGEILKMIINCDFHITNLKMIRLTADDIAESCFIEKDVVDKTSVINYLISGPVVALELLGGNGITRWQELAGPEDSNHARLTAASSLRARYGKDEIHNAVYGSKDSETVMQAMVAELQSGPCIVLEVNCKNESPNIVADFRNLCGPMDPAKVEYFFKILDGI
ncbi:Nucleoside diphosphate kinase 7 [Cyphomyrmex costatus]|uniref:Nucleoside diphosphate kinase 7 n=1 Tax=Cyphomyrmex costatus TaxID=456900 RepID=A0A151IQC9_9HYME|nr:Nucleoside diphosphate kinase 7 [Cyphomyrmex costatus]